MPSLSRHTRQASAVTALCLLVLVSSAAAAKTPPMRIAVLAFSNASSDPGLQSLGKGLQSMLTTDLSKVHALQLVERSRLQAILAEQELGRSGRVDKKTAARIGKLAGASHLLTGTYTVHGAKMRLDARLFAVEGGGILLAEQITGERDAFFELEKALVKKLIKTLGVKLKPKERAGIARIHTADFAAFKRFSGGIALFDEKKYQQAADAMRAAMKRDADFDLARLTLGQYEAVVAQLRAKATRLDLTKRELAALAADKVAQTDSLVMQRLLAIASEKGDTKRLRRLAALTFLIGFYSPYGRNHGRISRFQDRFDEMVVRGRIESLARRYFMEARAIFPGAPMFTMGRDPPDTPQLVAERVAGLATALGLGMAYRAKNRDRSLINNLSKVGDFSRLIALDRREAIALQQAALKGLKQLHATPYAIQQAQERLSALYLSTGDLPRASGALTRMSQTMTNVGRLKSVAKQVEKLGEVAHLLASTRNKKLARELVASGGGRLPSDLGYLTPGAPSRRLLGAIARLRMPIRWWSYRDPYWYLGALPAHLIQGEGRVITGPRIDGLRSDSVRYYLAANNRHAEDVLIVLGRNPRAVVDVTFDLKRRPAKDYWPLIPNREATGPADVRLDPGAPELSLVFGLHDIATHNVQDPVTRKHSYPRPTRGLAVRFGGDGSIALVQLGETPPSEKLRRRAMSVAVLHRQAGATRPTEATGAKSRHVRVHVVGTKVRVTVGRKTTTWRLPGANAATGYLGLHIRGVGYVAVDHLRVKK